MGLRVTMGEAYRLNGRVSIEGLRSERSIPFSRLGRAIEPPVIVELMSRALANRDLLSFAAGFTDNAVLPRGLVRRFAAELTEAGLAEEPLQYGSNQGRRGLRELTCRWLEGQPGERAEAFPPEGLFVTNGSQQALYLAARTLCDPGDIVLVQAPSYFVCLEMLKGLGLRAEGLPCGPDGAIDATGMAERLRELERAGERTRVKALYLVSYFGNPSSRSMPAAEKEAAAAALAEVGFGIPVIEDGAYRDLHYGAPHAAPSVFSMRAFDAFPKLYLGTYTKPFATGLKVGYGCCSDAAWLEKMLCMKGHQDFGTAHFNQAVVERVLEAGLYTGHLARIRRHYGDKAARLDAALEASGLRAAGWHWERPLGGLIFWLRGPEGLDLGMDSAFCGRCVEAGVLYVPGDLCFPGGRPKNFARLSIGALPAERFGVAVERFAKVAKSL